MTDVPPYSRAPFKSEGVGVFRVGFEKNVGGINKIAGSQNDFCMGSK